MRQIKDYMEKMQNVKIIDNVLSKNVLEHAYVSIIDDNVWNLTMNKDANSFSLAGSILYDKQLNISRISNSTTISLLIYMSIKDKVNFLGQDIQRIHLGAKAPLQDDILHKDEMLNKCYTILFYLNPTWKSEWGGETIVGDEVIEYKSNRAIIYDASTLHAGKAPKCPEFRTYINYVVKK